MVRLLSVPLLRLQNDNGQKESQKGDDGSIFVVVSKFGQVALYATDSASDQMRLLHTFALLPQTPECRRVELVVDAVYASDIFSIIFATTNCILLWYNKIFRI